MDSIETSKTVFKVTAYAKGIRNRCRKASRESFKLGELPLNYTPADLLDIKAKALAAVKSGMKEFNAAELQLLYCTVKNERGYCVESFELFDQRHQNFNLL